MTVIIGLMGPAGSGKSSVAQYLEQKYGAVRYSFAGPLKEMVGRALDFTQEQLYGTQAQKEAPDERYGGKSARWFLQRIGTEGCRKTFGHNFWVRILMERIALDRPELVVIDDARFVNESFAIQEHQAGYVWRLNTPGRETVADAEHASEQEWLHAPYDYALTPSVRDLAQLFDLVDEVAREMRLFPKRAGAAQ